jgi:hypothetical protein
MKPDCVICDIDGTIANIEHRRHWIANKPKNWNAFYAGMKDDKPIPEMVKVIKTLAERYQIIFVTGRPAFQNYRRLDDITQDWINTHVFMEMSDEYLLYMREEKDHRPDYVVKEEILKTHILPNWNPIIALEDRQQVVDMWRRNGILCAQVDEGKF